MEASVNEEIIMEFQALKLHQGRPAEKLTEPVVIEALCQIVLNDKLIATLSCSPMNLRELAVGYLISEGIATDVDSVAEPARTDDGYTLNISARALVGSDDLAKRVLTSGCAGGKSFAQPPSQPLVAMPVTIRREQLTHLVSRMADSSQVFQQTAGVHSAALCTPDQIIFRTDDIGRHNAVDKVIGWARLNRVELQDKLLLSTGRISSEIVLKAARSRITIVASRGAPTSRALNLARGLGLTVIGFVRGRRMTVYTCCDRCSD
ncbi:MAG: formate dehydrogenase accessory sulfurtransferase FdhD [Actinobacteria bacterium]|nr:formate dehydrogenase accessory sulfurtransferase FdhD [Actinomycetota bacterium]